jgi:N12 class adenine-specific DNA methylase
MPMELRCQIKRLKQYDHFLGFTNFYVRFIHFFSGIARLITNLITYKVLDFHWKPVQVVAFQHLENVFTSTSIWKHFDPSKEVVIETDTSNFAIVCIFSE